MPNQVAVSTGSTIHSSMQAENIIVVILLSFTVVMMREVYWVDQRTETISERDGKYSISCI